jgi:hypothetical protein
VICSMAVTSSSSASAEYPASRRWDGGGTREPSPDPVRDGVRS